MQFLPTDNSWYGQKAYWNDRYSKEDTFDWCRKFSDVAEEIHEFIPDKNSRIAMLGCGNSSFSGDMYDDGYENIVNVDFSSVCIQRMRDLHSTQRPKMTWIEGDIRHLVDLPSESFDVAIDKATMDAMMTAKHDIWNPPEDMVRNCRQEVDEVLRILKPGGVFLYITFGQPQFRKRYLIRDNTSLQVKELLTEGFSYFLYVLRKSD